MAVLGSRIFLLLILVAFLDCWEFPDSLKLLPGGPKQKQEAGEIARRQGRGQEVQAEETDLRVGRKQKLNPLLIWGRVTKEKYRTTTTTPTTKANKKTKEKNSHFELRKLSAPEAVSRRLSAPEAVTRRDGSWLWG